MALQAPTEKTIENPTYKRTVACSIVLDAWVHPAIDGQWPSLSYNPSFDLLLGHLSILSYFQFEEVRISSIYSKSMK